MLLLFGSPLVPLLVLRLSRLQLLQLFTNLINGLGSPSLKLVASLLNRFNLLAQVVDDGRGLGDGCCGGPYEFVHSSLKPAA